MAKVELGYPIAEATGRFGGGMFRRGSTQLLPAPPARPGKKERGGCECNAWKYADRLWAAHMFYTQPWRDALKKKGMSAYDLWMREAVHLAAHGQYYPDTPSISGGFSTKKVMPGYNWQPPACCVPDFFRRWRAWTRYQDPRKRALTVWLQTWDPRTPRFGCNKVEVHMYGHGWDKAPTWSCTRNRGWMKENFYAPIDHEILYYVRATGTDGCSIAKAFFITTPVRPPVRRTFPHAAWKHRGNWPSRCIEGKEFK